MPRRPVHLPLWSVVVLCVMATFGPILSITAAVQISNKNAAELVQRYEADQQMARAAAKAIYCTLFAVQIDALTPPQAPTAARVRDAWLAIYELAQCQPPRK